MICAANIDREFILKKKFTGLIFIFLICFAPDNIFCQPTFLVQTYLTWEIFNELQNTGKLDKVNFYLSKAFPLIISENNKTNKNVIKQITEDGNIVLDGANQPVQPIEFIITDKGKFDDFNPIPQGREVIEIIFPDKSNPGEKSIRLNFMRNTQKDRFELFSARINTNYFITRSQEPLYLVIMVETKNGLSAAAEVQAIPFGANRENFPGNKPVTGNKSANRDKSVNRDIQNDHSEYRGGAVNNSTIGGSVNGGTVTFSDRQSPVYIKGQGLLNRDNAGGIAAYIQKRNPGLSQVFVENLIETYFIEAGIEGINTDLAIAQMCQATNFLKNQNVTQPHNYAGFIPFRNGNSISFNNMVEGVRAHIQHLKGYASPENPKQLIVDPRWNILSGFRGTVNTLEELSRKWSPNNAQVYENNIKAIIDEMRQFCSR